MDETKTERVAGGKMRGGHHAKPERNAEIVAAHAAGESMSSIGRRHGVSPERIRQILAKAKRKEGQGT